MNSVVRDSIITYGPTLARSMSYDQAAEYIRSIEQSRGEGVIGVVVTQSHVPGASNVECAIEGLEPDRAIIALTTAATRLAKLHGRATVPTHVLDTRDGMVLRATAERLVDFCRASGFSADSQLLTRSFDHMREACVTEIMLALAAASMSVTTLEKGGS